MLIQPIEREYVACDICGGTDSRVLYTSHDRLHGCPGTYTGVKCRRCALVYLNPRPTAASLTGYYPPEYECYRDEARASHLPPPRARSTWVKRVAFHLRLEHTARRQWFGYPAQAGEGWYQRSPRLAPLLKLLSYPASCWLDVTPCPRPGRVLDIGCGNGKTLDRFSAEGWRTSGVELNPSIAERARQRGHDVFCGELAGAKFPEAHFEAVIIEHTLEHVGSPVALIREVHRILQPGGYFKIVVPNFGGLLARTFGQDWYMLDVPRHLYQFTPRTLRRLLESNGFIVDLLRTHSRPAHVVHSLEYAMARRQGAKLGPSAARELLERVARPLCRSLDLLRIGDELIVCARSRP